MTDPEYEELEDVLESAKGQVLRQEPNLAIAELRSVASRIDACPDSLIWAKFPLRLAQAYSATNNPVAEDFFRDALSRAKKLTEPCGELLIEAHKNFGTFLARNRQWGRALRQYERAEECAVLYGLSRELDALALLIEEAKLRVAKNPEARNFLVLRGVGYKMQRTSKQVRLAWRLHVVGSREARARTVFRREAATLSEAYFEDLLNQVGLIEDES